MRAQISPIAQSECVRLPPGASRWHRLVRCNPFYLFSALLLIYGIYRASIDPHFLRSEILQLVFNYCSLEIYGLMLVSTAIWLARKQIWYDSTLLVFLENIFVLIPFMLVSHAVFLGPAFAWTICLAGSLLAAGKFGAFKRYFHALNLPGVLLMIGAVILVVNVGIPLLFRKGLNTDNELWTYRSLYCWYLVIPLLVLLGNVVPSPHVDSSEPHRQRWIPLASFLLWIGGTATHLYTIGYVDQQKFGVGHISVIAWALSWLFLSKADHFIPLLRSAHKVILLLLPPTVTLLSLRTGKPVIFILLNLLNALVFAAIVWRNRELKLAAVLGGVSIVMAFVGVPEEAGSAVIKDYNKPITLLALSAAAGLYYSIRTRTAKGGLIGSLCVALIAGGICEKLHLSGHIILQTMTVFYLLHSLRWHSNQEPGARFTLVCATLLWVGDSFSFGQTGMAGFWAPVMLALMFVLIVVLVKHFTGKIPALILSGAVGVLIITPLYHAIHSLTSAPPGLLAVIGSFALFGAGTGLALWKRKTLITFAPQSTN